MEYVLILALLLTIGGVIFGVVFFLKARTAYERRDAAERKAAAMAAEAKVAVAQAKIDALKGNLDASDEALQSLVAERDRLDGEAATAKEKLGEKDAKEIADWFIDLGY